MHAQCSSLLQDELLEIFTMKKRDKEQDWQPRNNTGLWGKSTHH